MVFGLTLVAALAGAVILGQSDRQLRVLRALAGG